MKYLLSILLIILISSCAPKSQSSYYGDDYEKQYSADGKIITPEGEVLESDLDFQRKERFGEGNIPAAEASGLFRDVYFNYDSSGISDLGRQNVEYNAKILGENPSLKVQLEGHCDERGTAEYNLALGERRAKAVIDLLSSYGIGKNRMETISYGEELPIASGNNEESWAKNRRVHFSAFSR